MAPKDVALNVKLDPLLELLCCLKRSRELIRGRESGSSSASDSDVNSGVELLLALCKNELSDFKFFSVRLT